MKTLRAGLSWQGGTLTLDRAPLRARAHDVTAAWFNAAFGGPQRTDLPISGRLLSAIVVFKADRQLPAKA